MRDSKKKFNLHKQSKEYVGYKMTLGNLSNSQGNKRDRKGKSFLYVSEGY